MENSMKSIPSYLDEMDTVEDDGSSGEIVDYSQTNVQVQGVDEPDLVKTDGEYLYIVSSNKILIIKAYPVEDAEIITELEYNDSLYLRNIFVNGSKLVVFAETYNYPIYENIDEGVSKELDSLRYDSPDTYVKVYDITDIENPIIGKDIVVEGSFSGARLIGSYVYVVSTQFSYNYGYIDDDQVVIPRIIVDDDVKDIPLNNIYYVDLPEKSNTLINIISFDIGDMSKDVNSEVFILGNSHILYVSKDNIYVSYSASSYNYTMIEKLIDNIVLPNLPNSLMNEYESVNSLTLDDYQKRSVYDWIIQNYIELIDEEQKKIIAEELVKYTERTIIHRINIRDGEISYGAQGSIPGYVNNQFSLSEYEGYLRVSTTVQGWMVRSYVSEFESRNNLYILDMDLEIIGFLENLAVGEQIYSTRFIGDKGYLVTFKQIDPFFVIDLIEPTDPRVLGELKIPGYSTYLHPYDKSHIIGIGRDEEKIKISLFDVTDLNKPVELSKYEIVNNEENWHWSQSSALYEHKAFLFDKSKNLLVIPVGDYYKESAYVFNVTVELGIKLKGIITHDYKFDIEEENDPWYSVYKEGYSNSIKRTLYIDNVLFTISDNMVKMNDMDSLGELNSLILV
jgi:uncharacterized secreted protein with C-terminal beta-propeller domain